jgi:hypothetical protein
VAVEREKKFEGVVEEYFHGAVQQTYSYQQLVLEGVKRGDGWVEERV